MKLEIWLTDLDVEPHVTVQEDLVRVHLTVTDDLDGVLDAEADLVPEPLRQHFVRLWAGRCPERTFHVLDRSTLKISSERDDQD